MNLKILSGMDLAGQGMTAKDVAILRSARGYAMAALLVGLAVMSILLAVAMPVWKQASQREKEAELIFRGQQYARAIGLFQRRAGPGALPPNLDVLVQQRFLRKKYKDPITNDEFQPLLGGQPAPGTPGGQGAVPPGGVTPGGRGAAPVAPGATPGTPGGTAIGGIQGVVSKSKAKSIRLYNGRGAYNEWAFVFVPQQQAAGPGGAPGGRGGGPGGGPGRGAAPGAPGGGIGGPGGRGGSGGGGTGTPPGPFGPTRQPGGGQGGPGPFQPGGPRR